MFVLSVFCVFLCVFTLCFGVYRWDVCVSFQGASVLLVVLGYVHSASDFLGA